MAVLTPSVALLTRGRFDASCGRFSSVAVLTYYHFDPPFPTRMFEWFLLGKSSRPALDFYFRNKMVFKQIELSKSVSVFF